MASYATYRSSSAYTTKKNDYKTLEEEAFRSDMWNSVDKGIQVGASIGGFSKTISGALFGAGVGALVYGGIGWIKAANGHSENLSKLISDLREARTMYGAKAANELLMRNDTISLSKAFYKNTRRDYDTMYGSGSFAKLEETIMGTLNLGNNTVLSSVISNMQTDKVAGNIVSRISSSEYGNGVYANSDIEKLLEANFSLSDLGKSYTDYLYEVYTSSGGQFQEDVQLLEENLDRQLTNVDYNIENAQLEMAEQFASAFFNKKLSDIDSAERLGSTQSEESASGIRSDSRSSNQTKLQRYKQDLANASYAITQKFLQQKLIQSVTGLELTRENAFKDYQNSQRLLKREMSNNVTQMVDNYLGTSKSTIKDLRDREMAHDEYAVTAIAAHDAIDSANGKYNDVYEEDLDRVFTISGATK